MAWIACLGECMIELREVAEAQDAPPSTGPMRRGFGGDTLNTAIYAARCGARTGVTVEYVTALGDDPYSEEMLAAWRAEGVGTRLVRRLAGRRPGLYTIRVDQAGDRSFQYWRSASAARETIRAWGVEALGAALDGCDILYFSGITLGILDDESRAGLLRIAARRRADKAAVAFDSNFRPALWRSRAEARLWAERAYAVASLALPTYDDEHRLFGDQTPVATVERLQSAGVAEVVVKNGANPCVVATAGCRSEIAPEVVARPVDTTAAGDSFNAAYMVARQSGATPEAAAAAGHGLAARVIAAPGAIVPGVPGVPGVPVPEGAG